MDKLIHYVNYWGDANKWDDKARCGLKVTKKTKFNDSVWDTTCVKCVDTLINPILMVSVRKDKI
jgi:hypothetical protein